MQEQFSFRVFGFKHAYRVLLKIDSFHCLGNATLYENFTQLLADGVFSMTIAGENYRQTSRQS